MNVWDVVLIGAVLLAVVLAVRSILRTRRTGACVSCPFADSCGHSASRGASSPDVRGASLTCKKHVD